ncbi:MAG TPA: ATP-binding protein [Luteibacter sp.]|uniref:Dph6-related ATP pyrophosphatase n=1 Tax=Luteibacter sp. TaxID=1886636 RepID=UPI002BF9B4E0|nr:ATP-binding protein [Luteibacter sp.]HVI54778.1 ATP-binding protein [Luteibacter sp.]
MPTPIIVSWSGGKDCLMTLGRLRADPAWHVVGLLTTVTANHDRIAMHGVRRSVLAAQGAALGLPVIEAVLTWPSHNDAYEEAFSTALAAARGCWTDLAHIAFGDLFLADVRAYRDAQLARIGGWTGVYPLWGEDTASLGRHFVTAGHRAALCCVDTTQLDAGFCGRDYDGALLDALPQGVDPCGENGEFHTLSFGGPLFAHDMRLARGESLLRDGRFQYTDFLLDD